MNKKKSLCIVLFVLTISSTFLGIAIISAENNNIYFGEIGPFSGGTTITYWIKAIDNASQMTETSPDTFTIVDNSGPTISIKNPTRDSTIYDKTPTIKVSYYDPSGIDTSSIILSIDDIPVTSLSTITSTTIIYTPTTSMKETIHKVKITVSDNLGNIVMATAAKTPKIAITITNSISVKPFLLLNIFFIMKILLINSYI